MRTRVSCSLIAATVSGVVGLLLVSGSAAGAAPTAYRQANLAAATPQLYWVNYGPPGSVASANIDGSSANESFITGTNGPTGVAVDGQHIYWTDTINNTIGRANLDGSEPNQSFITGADRPAQMAVDGHYIYWANFNTNTIERANLDGTGVDQSFISTAGNPSGVAVDGQHIYWTSSTYNGTTGIYSSLIGRANHDGTGVNQSFINVTGVGFVAGVTVDSQHVYWDNAQANTIGRASLDGSGANESFIGTGSDPVGVAVDGQYIYWTNSNGNTSCYCGTIGRANLDGSSPNQGFINGASYPFQLVVTQQSPPNVVVNTNDSGPGSLRAAIEFVNTNPGPDTISFAIPMTDPGFNGRWFTIQPLSLLPALTDDGTTIDGSTQTLLTGNTNSAGPEIFVDGRSQVGQGSGVWIRSSSNVVVGLTVSGFPGQQIAIGFCQSTDCPLPQGSDGNVVRGNYVGTDPTGALAIQNANAGNGLEVMYGATNTVIGGTTAAARNVISGNGFYGIELLLTTGAVIEGNYIGTNAAANAPLGNFTDGVRVGLTSTVTIGGTAPGAGNVISGNGTGHNCCGVSGAGVGLTGGSSGSSSASTLLIEGNLIGTDASGAYAIPNSQDGVTFFGHNGAFANTVIGGTTAAARNVISGNAGAGIGVSQGPTGSTPIRILGNYIGTNLAGTAAVPNQGAGIENGATDTLIGGVAAGTGNLISGNAGWGLNITASGAIVQGNLVGTDAAGTSAVGNGGPGIRVAGTTATQIGGTTAAARNVVSGNAASGIAIIDGSSGTDLSGNYIGIDKTGAGAVPNAYNGISIRGGANQNTIGGAGAGNVIAHNGSAGVAVYDGASNAIRRNSIFSNGGLGIDLGGDGVTLNNCCGHAGPNSFQNFPVLKNANTDPVTNKVVVVGSIDTPNPTTVTIEFFANAVPTPGADPSGYGEGATFLGTVTPKANGKFTAMLPLVPAGTVISATATDALGNTSEFAADIPAK
jgi:hypothetical protein